MLGRARDLQQRRIVEQVEAGNAGERAHQAVSHASSQLVFDPTFHRARLLRFMVRESNRKAHMPIAKVPFRIAQISDVHFGGAQLRRRTMASIASA